MAEVVVQPTTTDQQRMAMLSERQAAKRTDLARTAPSPFVAAGPMPVSAAEPTSVEETGEEEIAEEEEEVERTERFLAEQQRATISATRAQVESKATEAVREEAKKAIKAGVRRGAQYLIESIAGTLDTGTIGISTPITLFVHLFNFAWLNVEMIYGSYIAGGKSKLIDPLTWNPFPIPISVIVLHGALIAFDIGIIIMLTVWMTIGILILATVVSFMTNPLGTIGSLVQTASEFGFLSDILGPMF